MSVGPARSGALLLLVAGLSAMLMAICMAFLARMRADGEEGALLVAEAQARLMLHAAMLYVQEGSRLGWDDPGTPEIEESFGWTDVRDGAVGPRGAARQPLWSDATCFPAPGGRAARFPMHVLERPPFAIYAAWNPNPVDPDAAAAGSIARFTAPDPRPVATTWADFRQPPPAALQPRMGSVNMAWFRVWREPPGFHDGAVNQTIAGRSDYWDTIDLRDHHGIFLITCGAGGTNGYRDAVEAAADPASPEALRDPAIFAILRASERILWYRVEWSPSVGQMTLEYERNGSAWYDRYPQGGMGLRSNFSAGAPPVDVGDAAPTGLVQSHGRQTARSFLGTFAWVQRLDREPPTW